MIGASVVTIFMVTWLNFHSGYAIDTPNLSDDVILIPSKSGEGSGAPDVMHDDAQIWSNDIPPLLTTDADILRTTIMSKKAKRATPVFYNGYIDRQFYSTFSYSKPLIPPTALIPLNRPLQRGNGIPQLQYIALWTQRGQPPHWGIIYQNNAGKLDGSFVKDSRIINLSDAGLQNTSVKLLQYVGTEYENNFKFAWTRAIDADMATVVSEKALTPGCHPRMAPAILQEHGYEFLGEADIDNRVMFYVHDNSIHKIDGSIFTNNVLLLTKQQCRCSCQSTLLIN